MDLELVMLGSLVLTMGLFGLALAVAWARFGRQVHVALWSIAFFLSATGHLAYVVALGFPPARTGAGLVAVCCSLLCASLFSQGFRKRAGLEDWRGVAVVTVLMFVVASAAMALWPADYRDRALVNACVALLFLFSAQALRSDPRGRNGAARATLWMVTAFSVYLGGLGILALFARPGGPMPPVVYDVAMLLGGPAMLSGVGLFAMLLLASDLAARLQRLASLDPLTGVLNRRGVDDAAARMLAYCRRFDRSFSIVIADLDRFKSINDRFGHALGDLVLQRFAAHCEATVREGDLVGRLGGEEFVIALADADADAAGDAMERVRAGLPAALADLALPVPVTASFGIATLEGRDDTLAAMLVRADGALYGAKGDGRDRIIVAPAPVAGTPGGTDPRFLAAFAGAGAEAGDARARPAYGRRS
jgi:diguanylate cyclase (GGDEF)-like protein